MIKIRPCCFETNSSSMDRYDDYRHYGETETVTARCTQHAFIEFGVSDGLTNKQAKALFNKALDDDLCEWIIDDVMKELWSRDEFEARNLCDGYTVRDDDLMLDIEYSIYAAVDRRWLKIYEEYEYLDFTYECIDMKSEGAATYKEPIEMINKKLKELGYNDIFAICAYGEDINNDDFDIRD